MTATIKAVLFDIGNVFVHWDPRFLYEKLVADPAQLDFLLSHVITLDWHSQHDRGVPFRENIAARCAEFPDYADLIRAYDPRWEETVSGPVTGTADLLERLVDGGIKCVALTNFPAEKWPDFTARYAFTSLLAGAVVSGAEHVIKPDPRIFQIAMTRYDLDPEQTLFVDDRPQNTDAAALLGFATHVFTDAASLEADLTARGLL